MDSDASRRHLATAALDVLLRDLFDGEELRRWIRRYKSELAPEMLGPSASLAALSDDTAHRLVRWGFVDDAFFNDLIAARKQRRADIETVRALFPALETWGVRNIVWRRCLRISRNAALLCGSVWLFTRAYPKLDVSVSLRHAENGLFLFLPPSYKQSGLLCLTLVSASLTLLLWLLLRSRGPRPDEKANHR